MPFTPAGKHNKLWRQQAAPGRSCQVGAVLRVSAQSGWEVMRSCHHSTTACAVPAAVTGTYICQQNSDFTL